jgi:hypothetical protein
MEVLRTKNADTIYIIKILDFFNQDIYIAC